MASESVWEIIHSLKLVDYLPVQMHKPYNTYFFTINKMLQLLFTQKNEEKNTCILVSMGITELSEQVLHHSIALFSHFLIEKNPNKLKLSKINMINNQMKV